MKTLDFNQMEKIEGGEISNCAAGAIGLGLTFIGAFFVTTPVGAAVFAASFIWGSATLDC